MPSAPPPIQNDGISNTCYINTAIQVILTIAKHCPRSMRPVLPPLLKEDALRKGGAVAFYDSCAEMVSDKLNKSSGRKVAAKVHAGLQQDACEAFQSMVESDMSFAALLSGSLLKDVKCRCGHLSRTTMPFVVLDLPLNDSNGRPASTLVECIDGLFCTSRVSDYQCDGHKGIGSAEITHRMHDVYPIYFAMMLQRGVRAHEQSKKHITFWRRINLTPVVPDGSAMEKVTYDLISVVMHAGDMKRGHYTSYQLRDDAWFFCNDAAISECPGPVDDGTAVMLVYAKKH
jgi:ubiquitin C-terminal hydrolase